MILYLYLTDGWKQERRGMKAKKCQGSMELCAGYLFIGILREEFKVQNFHFFVWSEFLIACFVEAPSKLRFCN